MTKHSERTQQTKADFQEAFWRLYSTTPMVKITVAQVCQLAGYNRATFYLHFSDIYDLLQTIEDSLLEGMAAVAEENLKRLGTDNSKPALVSALKNVLVYYEKHKRYILVLLGPQGDPRFTMRLKDAYKPLWRRYIIKDTGSHSEQEIDLMLEFVLSGTLSMIASWIQDPGDISLVEMGKLVYDVAIRQVAALAAS